jgi:hypothetical protein
MLKLEEEVKLVLELDDRVLLMLEPELMLMIVLLELTEEWLLEEEMPKAEMPEQLWP